MNLGTLVFVSHLHPPREAHVPLVWLCLHDYDALGLIL